MRPVRYDYYLCIIMLTCFKYLFWSISVKSSEVLLNPKSVLYIYIPLPIFNTDEIVMSVKIQKNLHLQKAGRYTSLLIIIIKWKKKNKVKVKKKN
jgi:hypothetical protein